MMRAALRMRRRASFRRSYFGLSIVRSSGHTRPGALAAAVIAAVACVVSFKIRRLSGQTCAKRAPGYPRSTIRLSALPAIVTTRCLMNSSLMA